jgi:hypothetical protein
MTKHRYDPADDSRKSYDADVVAKRERGDSHWPERTERLADPETEKQMKRLKRALDRRLRQGGGHG